MTISLDSCVLYMQRSHCISKLFFSITSQSSPLGIFSKTGKQHQYQIAKSEFTVLSASQDLLWASLFLSPYLPLCQSHLITHAQPYLFLRPGWALGIGHWLGFALKCTDIQRYEEKNYSLGKCLNWKLLLFLHVMTKCPFYLHYPPCPFMAL